jgi:uncharacterized protein (DUF1499 family)
MRNLLMMLCLLAVPTVAQELAPCPSSPNCVSSLASVNDAEHAVAPLVLIVPAADAWPLVRETAMAMPRTRLVSENEGYLHAEVTSRIFRFVDDLELVLNAAEGRVDVRSASRTGYGDMGVNRKRVEQLRLQLQQQGVIAVP